MNQYLNNQLTNFVTSNILFIKSRQIQSIRPITNRYSESLFQSYSNVLVLLHLYYTLLHVDKKCCIITLYSYF